MGPTLGTQSKETVFLINFGVFYNENKILTIWFIMRKSHLNDEFLVLLGPIISRLFTCSNEEKNKQKHQRVLALVLFYACPAVIGRKKT
jgi:hypothetical protein